ncbi:hypothetical protein, partial [Bosea sp. (in: a-proteobacteria)]|uniref:hypothetical protein n=1 Tax=Bosea sp. (in: a-proteobacteria) TaxID=1871050 RepID=UPI004033CB1A
MSSFDQPMGFAPMRIMCGVFLVYGLRRHCERSEAIQSRWALRRPGLLRCARIDDPSIADRRPLAALVIA